MTYARAIVLCAWVLLILLAVPRSAAAEGPAPKEGHWVVRDFRFHTGEVLPELRLHYTTIGAPTGEPVLILHGTTGSGAGLLAPTFGGELFGPGQPLDASRYYVVLPDAIGHGKSSKPSDGLRTRFPAYNYDDMVQAHYRLLTEHLGVRRLRLVLGNSMGGMEVWIFAQKYPAFMDLAVPMASLPTEMASRNWMMRRLIIDAIRNDPEWMNGNYTKQPRSAQIASVFYGLATSGGNHALYAAAPTREKADQLLNQRLAAPFTADANDVLYQWDSSRDYNPRRRPGADPGGGAGDQLRRRRAQPARARHHGARDQAREARPLRADPGRPGHARPRDHQHGEILEASPRRAARLDAAGGEVGRSAQAALHQHLTQRRRVLERSRFPGVLEAAPFVVCDRGAVGRRGPEVEVLGAERARPLRHALDEGGAHASPPLRRVDEHPDQHRRMLRTVRMPGDAGRQADPAAGFLGNEGRALQAGGAAGRSFVPDGFGKRLFAGQVGAEGHRCVGQRTQTNLAESETFVRADASDLDRRLAGAHCTTPTRASSARREDRTRWDGA